MKIEKMKRYFSKSQYARQVNLCPHSVRQLIKSGKIKTEMVGSTEKIVVETWQGEIENFYPVVLVDQSTKIQSV